MTITADIVWCLPLAGLAWIVLLLLIWYRNQR